MGQGDIGPEQPAATQLGNLAARRRRCAGVGMNPPAPCACVGPSGREPVEICPDKIGGGECERGVGGRSRADTRRDENRAHTGVGVGRQRSIKMSGVIGKIAPVDDGGDARRERSEQSDERGGVDVVR